MKRTSNASMVLTLLAFATTIAQGAALVITNVALPKGTVGIAYKAQLGATNGQTPYSWSLASNSASLPFGLSLKTNGLLSGTPTTRQTNSIIVQVMDANSAKTTKVLSITILPRPVILPPTPIPPTNATPVSGCQFQIPVSDACGRPITIQYSTNLVDWVNLLTTNLPCDTVTLTLQSPSCGIGYVRVRAQDLCPVFVATTWLFFADPANGTPVQSQTLTIQNLSWDCPLNFNAVCSPWLVMTNAGYAYTNISGSVAPLGVVSIPVAVSDAKLFAGAAYHGSILVSDTLNPDNSQYVPVVLQIDNAQFVPQPQPGASYGYVDVYADCNHEFEQTPMPTGLQDVSPFDLNHSVSSSGCTNYSGYSDASANLVFQFSRTSVSMSANVVAYETDPFPFFSSGAHADSNGGFSFHPTHLSRYQISGSLFNPALPDFCRSFVRIFCGDAKTNFQVFATNFISTKVFLTGISTNGDIGFMGEASSAVQGPGIQDAEPHWDFTVQLVPGPP